MRPAISYFTELRHTHERPYNPTKYDRSGTERRLEMKKLALRKVIKASHRYAKQRKLHK